MISLTSDLREEFLAAAAPGRVRFDEPMRLHTTFHIGGPAQIWVEPADAQELRQLLQIAQGAALSVTLVSGGANLLVRDEGIPGLVIHLGAPGFQGVDRTDDGAVRAGAGLPLEWLIRRAKEDGLSGLEFLAGVPGRLGGAVRMNAGTHDDEGNNHSISDVIRSVTVMELDGQIRTIPREEIGFGYRTSDLPGRIVLESELLLTPDAPERIAQRVKRLWEFKRKTQDWTAPSVGCIFKNPPAHSAGRLIDQAGLKGFRIGGAAISSIHANFMMNVRQARAADVFGLIEEARSRVRRISGVELELEVQVAPV
ncbi:MAG: UDP-N-acetylmuramate dehydrogenase [Candidatus Omnitrophica bacterium]|nr:UDP-N-acetylmuramate dehydrogenase [Candidatus Omnitrophota bacterium]